MTYSARNLVVAMALALAAALLVGLYVSNYKTSVEHSQQHVTVYVAAKQIPAGMSGAEAVSKGYLKSSQVLRQSVVPGAISSPDQVKTLVASQDVFPGDQVSLSRFSNVAEHGLRGFLRGNMRAVQIAGDANQTLAGVLQTGDRVDLVSNIKLTDQPPKFVDRIVLRNLKVLKTPGTATQAANLSSNGSGNLPVMLAVSDTQVQKLFYTVKNNDWTLELRPVVKASDSAESVETKRTIIEDGLNPNAKRIAYGGAR
jgi:Flp pilus assembly protein CpaB